MDAISSQIREMQDKIKKDRNYKSDSIYIYNYYESPKKFSEIVNNRITNYRIDSLIL